MWEPSDGHLTRVDTATIEVTGSQKPRGFPTGKKVNRVGSDLAVANGSAWVSDPAADLIHKMDY